MSTAVSESERDAVRGEVRLVDDAARAELEASLIRQGQLLVPLPSPGPALRGRLALYVEGAIEDALERRGASPPGVGASSDLDASLSDQLYRARQVGAKGIVLSIYSLEGIANLAGAFDAEDSAVLRWWLAATAERPVRLLLDGRDRHLSVYGPPLALHCFVEPAAAESSEPEHAVPSADPELCASSAAMELSAPPPTVVIAEEPPKEEPTDPSAMAVAMAALLDDGAGPPEPLCTPGGWEAAPATESAPVPEPAQAREAPEAPETPETPEPDPVEVESSEPPPAVVRSEPRPVPESEWRGWMRELEGTRGPKPLAVVERMFVSAYVPLSDAVSRGYANDDAVAALEAWATSFDKSYSEAFDALRVRGKRPTMVLDAPDIALRIGRLHGARSVQLLLVDGMRFDLGMRVHDRLRLMVGQRAALTEKLLLWSALPTTTAVQLELIGRGPQGLREPIDAPESDIPVARGKSAATPRRIRAGQRELMKLDVVESAMSVPGGPLAERLDDLADETASILATHLSRMPPRTLVMVFGDHGFVLEPQGGGTSAGLQGGASPEEVLVPAYAWLVGAVH